MTYEIVKSLHIISVISWMAGMLYLPRLFVYHAQAQAGGELSETLMVMERKLLRYIMNPAMIATWVFGIWLMMIMQTHQAGWMHGKLLLVVLMTGIHHVFSYQRKQFAKNKNTHSVRYYKILNEVPTLMMIAIVFLVVLKPF
jgi:putative membrane protein